MVPTYPSLDDKHSNENATDQANQVNEGRELFAHYIWNAAIVVAEGVEDTYYSRTEPQPEKSNSHELWHVEGESVLELGAGEWPLFFIDLPSIHPSRPTNTPSRRRSPFTHLRTGQRSQSRSNRPSSLTRPLRPNRLQHVLQSPRPIHRAGLYLTARMGRVHRPLRPGKQGRLYPHHRGRLLLAEVAA